MSHKRKLIKMEQTVKVVKVIDVVKGNKAVFIYAQSGVLFYKVESETDVYIFPVDLNDKDDVGATRFDAEYPAITLMRYVNKAIKSETLATYKK